MMKTSPPTSIGMIGAGFISQIAHLPAFLRLPACQVTALADDRAKLLSTVADLYQIGERYTDYRDLLNAGNIDAVVVSMPRRSQSAILREVVRRSRPVLCEKPLAFTSAVARDLERQAQERNCLIATSYQRRYDAGVILFVDAVQKAIADNSFGALLHVKMSNFCASYSLPIPDHVRSSISHTRYPEDRCVPDWMDYDLARDYEYTVNVAIHDLNLLRMIFPDELFSICLCVRRKGTQTITLGLHQADVCLSVGPADVGVWDQRIDVYFRRGCISLVQESTLVSQSSGIVIQRSSEGEKLIRPPVQNRTSPFRTQAEAFVQAVRGKQSTVSTIHDAIRDLELIEDLWRHARVL